MAISLKPVVQKNLSFTIVGISSMIQHNWDEKSKTAMREKHAGKKTKTRAVRDPDAECDAALYRTVDGQFAIPAMAFKGSLITAAHKDIGIEKTLLRKALFLKVKDPTGMLPMVASDPIQREDTVRVGAGSTDLRYRPEFHEWSVDISITYDSELLQEEDIVNLVNRAGFGCGIGEWRPEKGGEHGRYEVDVARGMSDK